LPKFLTTTVNVNLSGLRKFRDTLEGDLRLSSNGPIRKALQDWGVIYGRFLIQRYFVFSMGGGNWPKLKPATLERKKKAGLLPWILRATDQMFQSFAPEFAAKPGGLTTQVPFGVRVGFGGGMRWPHSTADMPIAELAAIHQKRRKIIVPPDTATRKLMRDRMDLAVREALKG
jgi:hypothetical protein